VKKYLLISLLSFFIFFGQANAMIGEGGPEKQVCPQEVVLSEDEGCFTITLKKTDTQEDMGFVNYKVDSLNKNKGIIINILVDEKFRRKGVGFYLLTLACDELRKNGCKMAEVDVSNANEPSLQLFKKFQCIPLSIEQAEAEGIFLIGVEIVRKAL